MELAGKYAVVTGAGSGIGRACAIRFASEGARLHLADVDADRVRAVAAEIGATATRTDVSREREIKRLVQEVQASDGPIDLFFSNAGVAGPPGALRRPMTSCNVPGRST